MTFYLWFAQFSPCTQAALVVLFGAFWFVAYIASFFYVGIATWLVVLCVLIVARAALQTYLDYQPCAPGSN